MALGDVILGLNPMDLVEGYRKGLELGRERQRGEQEELRTQIMRDRDIPEAKRRGQESTLSFEATEAEREPVFERMRAALRTKAGTQAREEAFGKVLTETQPGRLDYVRQSEAQERNLIPERLGVRRDELRQRGLGIKEQISTVEQRTADRATIQEAQEAEVTIRSRPDMQGKSEFEVFDEAMTVTRDPRAREIMRRKRDAVGVEQIAAAARGRNIGAANTWIKRMGKPYQLELRDVDDPARPGAKMPVVVAWETQTIAQPDGTQIEQRVEGQTPGMFSVDPNREDYIGRMLPDFLGVPVRQTTQSRARAPARQAAEKPAKPVKTTPQTDAAEIVGATPESTRTERERQEARSPMNRRLLQEEADKYSAGGKELDVLKKELTADLTGRFPNPLKQAKIWDEIARRQGRSAQASKTPIPGQVDPNAPKSDQIRELRDQYANLLASGNKNGAAIVATSIRDLEAQQRREARGVIK